MAGACIGVVDERDVKQASVMMNAVIEAMVWLWLIIEYVRSCFDLILYFRTEVLFGFGAIVLSPNPNPFYDSPLLSPTHTLSL